jgi:DNA-binding NtrC family response regulator
MPPSMMDFSPANKTILLLVSDPVMKDALRDALVSGGYQVVISTELGAAVDRAREVWPDLLITRPYISSMPGQTAATYLRAKRPGLPVLIVSGFIDDDRVHNQHAIERFHVFPKPFTREELLEKVREVFLAPR